MTSQVVGTDFTNGSQLPKYVNGRLLTAEDLATSQATLRTHDRRLGRAAGHGIVDGLWVTASATTLTVAAGLAVAPSGDSVSVGATVTLPLTFAAPPAGSAGASFACCSPATPAGGAAITSGPYLLTVLPACQVSGSAPMAGPPGSSGSAGCAAQWQVEGVQFKAIALPFGTQVLGVEVTAENRRTLLAHWCLGTAQLATLGADLFNFSPAYGGLDTLDPADLTPADVPLAVFFWNGQAVEFIDNWSARRTITAPDPVTTAWSGVVSDRRRVDGQARLMQFQDQAADIVAAGGAGQTSAATTFPLLPPVGFLPISPQQVTPVLNGLRQSVNALAAERQRAAGAGEANAGDVAASMFSLATAGVRANLARAVTPDQLDAIESALAATSTQPGFDLATFFGDEATCGGIIDWDVADFALRQSWEMAPAAVAADTFGRVAFGSPALAAAVIADWRTAAEPAVAGVGREAAGHAALAGAVTATPLIWYLVLQNIAAGNTGAAPTLYVVFMRTTVWSRGTHLPFLTGQSIPTPNG